MTRRPTRLVLVVSSDPHRLRAYEAMARDVGAYALPAPLLGRAIALVRKVRPSAVLADVALSDGRSLNLVRAMRAVEPLAHVPVVLRGVCGPDEAAHLPHDPWTHGVHTRDDAALSALLRDLLEDARGPRT